jgi:1-deoxy-D-xylulose-5-phosphate synthase
MPRLLETIDSPEDLKKLAPAQLEQLAAEIRDEIIATVNVTGGHLASNLGVVELTIALHRVFDSPCDKIIWDVSHQSYVHKLLTGRRARFNTLRQYGGISGFTSRDESEHDPFGTGHASTSVSAALGMAVARDLTGDDCRVIAVIGDGAMTAGMAYEAMNHAGHLGSRLIVILNDNGMSISPTVGALAKLLSRVRFAKNLGKAKQTGQRIVTWLPKGKTLWRAWQKLEDRVKGFFSASPIWEELGFTYIGPIDGHNLRDLETVLTQVKNSATKPTLVHIVTTKGKGYPAAEDNAVYFHGVSAGGGKKKEVPTYSEVFAQTMVRLAETEPRLVVVTPAMPEGNCLTIFAEKFPDRIFDVGICEQHAVTFAAGMAAQGLRPVVAIYSTFLQRSFDQIIHDVCLQNLPVVFAVDRGGIVGDDGKTHQGIFDISYLSLIPNLVVAAPKDENELQHLLYSAVYAERPMAVRYPRGAGVGVKLDSHFHGIPIGRSEVLRSGEDATIFALGVTVAPALTAAAELEKRDVRAGVVNVRYAKPLDPALIDSLPAGGGAVLTVEENVLTGGFGSAFNTLVQSAGRPDLRIGNLGVADEFVEHGTQAILRARYGLDAAGIVKNVLSLVPEDTARRAAAGKAGNL